MQTCADMRVQLKFLCVEVKARADVLPSEAYVYVMAQRGDAIDVTEPVLASEGLWSGEGETITLVSSEASQTELVAMLEASEETAGEDDTELATRTLRDTEVFGCFPPDATAVSLAPRWIELASCSQLGVDVRIQVILQVSERVAVVPQPSATAEKDTSEFTSVEDALACGSIPANGLQPSHLMIAARLPQIDAIEHIIRAHPGAAAGVYDEVQGTPLHVAARHGRAEAIPVLIAAGVDDARVDSLGRAPIHVGVLAGRGDAVAALLALERGRDIATKARDKKGFTPLEYATANGTCADVLRDIMEHRQ